MTNILHITEKWRSFAPYFLSILRIVAAAMFMLTGTMKLFAFPVGIPPAGGTVELFSLLGLAGVLEVFGGLLILVGFFTRPVAFVLAVEMVVAYFIGHAPNGPWPILNGGLPALMYFLIWLYFSAAGSGRWSIDAKRAK